MKIGVLHVNSSGPESTSPTMRIARFAAQEAGATFIHDKKTAAAALKTKFDLLLVKFGMLKFSDHRDEALEIYNNAKITVNLENDYTFVPDKRFSQVNETWSTVEGRSQYVNWNVLTRMPVDHWKVTTTPKPTVVHEGLLYYGAHREGRVPYFKRYLTATPRYPVTISTFRGRKMFEQTCGSLVNIIGAFRDPDAPAAWPLTIYIEDETSHELYCSPANRFYECLQMGLPQAVDRSAVNTLKSGGIKVPEEFIVDNATDIKRLLLHHREVMRRQHRAWHRDFSLDLREQFHKALKGITKC